MQSARLEFQEDEQRRVMMYGNLGDVTTQIWNFKDAIEAIYKDEKQEVVQHLNSLECQDHIASGRRLHERKREE